MKFSRDWLQTYFGEALPSPAALGEALTFHAFEIEGISPSTTLGTGNDTILDVKVTPNRGHDCLSHRGIAKELSAILNVPMKLDPLRMAALLEPKTDAISISIQRSDLCSRYVAGYIRGIRVGPSPDWLRTALESVGQRSVNNVVDATNYVMLDLGQPLHAFDAGKLSAKNGTYAIGVRSAKKGEKMLALDDKEYTLSDSDLIIVDGNSDAPIGIAGVKGGEPAGVGEATTDIIIESANFDGVSVRRTSHALKLRTDASARFEQTISSKLAAYGMHAATRLIVKLAGGEVVGFSDEYPMPQKSLTVAVSLEKINGVLGTSFTEWEVAKVFERLDFPLPKKDIVSPLRTYDVLVPFERLDLRLPEDLIEEIGRIMGYDTIPPIELAAFPKKPEINARFFAAETVREEMMAKGYSEVYTSIFADKGKLSVTNKADSVRSYLRVSLTDGLKEAYEKNVHNKDLLGLQEVKLFEIGTVWRGAKQEDVVVGAIDKAGVHEFALSEGDGDSYSDLPVSKTERYAPFSKYPFIVRDIALWVSATAQADAVLNIIRTHAGELLVRSEKFDEFKKGDKISYAFRLIFQSFDRTLTDEDANERMDSIYGAVKKEGWEVR